MMLSCRTLFSLLISLLVLFFCTDAGVPPANRQVNQLQMEKPEKINEHLSKANIQRPAHLEAVPLERDGSLNKEFRKEVLLGEDTNDLKGIVAPEHKHDEHNSELGDKIHLEASIRHMFSKADNNSDGKLSEEELKQQILFNTNRHLDEARKESNEAFQAVDENGDGKVNWNEYKAHFIVEKGLVEKEHAKDHVKHSDSFDRDSRLQIEEEKHAFDQADADNDGLDEIEWLSFRHPEHSQIMLKEMAEEILKSFDTNNDGFLTEDEFARVNGGDVTDVKMEQEYIEARRHEFKVMIDKNEDGQATVDELLQFVNPRNERHAVEEVREIMSLADSDGDSHVTLDELLAKMKLLESTGFIHPKARLHDDL